MAISDNIHDRDKKAYKENTTDNGLDRRVTDLTTQGKLDQVITALGGSPDTTVTIFNLNIPTANIEVSQIMPVNTKGFLVRSRNRSTLKIAYNLGDTNTQYLTLKPGAVYDDKNYYSTLTVYFQSSANGETVEIVAYT